MAHNAFQFTVTPSIPQDLLCGLEGHLLMNLIGNEVDDGNTRYFYCDDDANQGIDIDDDLLALVESGTGPIAEKLKALDLENAGLDTLDLEFDASMDFTDILAALSAAHPEELPRIEIQGCWHSSKMRPGEFGGFATVITPTSVETVDTAMWLRAREPKQEAA